MKNLNSKKARNAVSELMQDLVMYTTWAFADATIDSGEHFRNNRKYWTLQRAKTVIELVEVWGFENCHYESCLRHAEELEGIEHIKEETT